MKNRILTNSKRTIKENIYRFLSLLIMSFLGTFVFMGLLSTAPDMIDTIDKYLDNYDVYDIKIVSTLGLVDEDMESLGKIDGISSIMASNYKDVTTNIDDSELVVEIISIPSNINKLELLSGEYPKSSNEIVVEESMLKNNNLNILDKIIVKDDDFKSQEFTITGTVKSPLFYNSTSINSNRGNTSIGSGVINYYGYVDESAFDQNHYTSIYITIDNAKYLTTSSREYDELVSSVKDRIESIKEEREEARYNALYKDYKDEVTKKENKAKKELAKAKKELDTAKKKLDSAKKSLDSNKEFLDDYKKILDSSKSELDNKLYEFNMILNNLNINIEDLDLMDSEAPEYLLNLKYQKQTLDSSRSELNSKISEYDNNIKKYNAGYREYKSNFSKYNKSLKKYNSSKKKIDKEISLAKEKLNDIPRSNWYIQDRTDYLTYQEYIDDTYSISNLATIFPIVFFFVAVLVSLISMNRMVEDDRNEIGTLKSLGFKSSHIMVKYILFSLLATLFGGLIGCILGSIFIPNIIYNIYRILFDLPNLSLNFDVKTSLIGFLITIVCVCGSTMFTLRKVLKERPAELMRPKAPKKGKRVFLERVPSIWNRLKFSNKVTIRNLFRYKKRVLVTVIGIIGCTALVLCGFGIKDAIVNITNMQYGETFKYDAFLYEDGLEVHEKESLLESEYISSMTSAETFGAKLDKSNIHVVVIEDIDSVSNIVSFKDKSNKEMNLGSRDVFITEKIASIKNIKVDDNIELLDKDGKVYNFKVTGIVKNYVEHYLFISKDLFTDEGYTYKENIIYMNTAILDEEMKDELTNLLLKNSKIINVTYIDTLKNSVSNMLKSLDKVVVILILLASSLSFVVLYNLSNINIHERKREIATLKVLGFYNKEVDNYITKENIILTLIGIIFGLVFGYFLTHAVVSSVEIEKARFIRHIKLNSFIYASLISIGFTIIVNIVTHFSLKKIDMISSLKSVE